jgi:predicted RNA binding protein YcfA (HicA-like mRNA interferase family)
MSKREKRLQRLRQNPNSVTFDDLTQVLSDAGFELDHVTGSHHVFRANVGDEVWTLVIPFARPVKPAYVRKAVNAIDEVLAAQTEQDANREEEQNDD